MEDHRDAYFFWKDHGIQDACCVHVDAHLDVSDRRLPGYAGFHPEINCGNYLFPAMQEGIVSELVWVVPPHLRGELGLLEWAQDELQNWVHLTVAEYQSLHLVEDRVEGELLGCRLVICTSDRLPAFSESVLLDIDADYYLGPEDQVWQSPLQLRDHLKGVEPRVLTVAVSMAGGFTPLHRRHLGALTVAAFEEPEKAQGYQALLEREEDESSPEPEEAPGWLRAALRLRDYQPEEQDYPDLEELDTGYRVDTTDLAWWRLSRQKFDLARSWIERMPEGSERDYLAAFCAFQEKDDSSAQQHWRKILETPDLDRSTRRHLLELTSRSLLRQGEARACEATVREALKLERRDGDLWLLLGQALDEAGELEQSARSFRKAVSCFRDRLEGLRAQLELAEVYRKAGEKELALAQCRRITRGDVPGLMKVKAEMIALKVRVTS